MTAVKLLKNTPIFADVSKKMMTSRLILIFFDCNQVFPWHLSYLPSFMVSAPLLPLKLWYGKFAVFSKILTLYPQFLCVEIPLGKNCTEFCIRVGDFLDFLCGILGFLEIFSFLTEWFNLCVWPLFHGLGSKSNAFYFQISLSHQGTAATLK